MDPTMNLINKTHHSCKTRKYRIITHFKVRISYNFLFQFFIFVEYGQGALNVFTYINNL